MEQRLTVSDLYKPAKQLEVQTIQKLSKAYFCGDWLFVISEDNKGKLKKYCLKSWESVEEYSIQTDMIKSVIVFQNLISIVYEGDCNLTTISSKGELVSLVSHISPITFQIRYRNYIATASDDMTVRFWIRQQDQLVQNFDRHIMFGHTGKINVMEVYQQLLISGSNDRTIVFWKDTQQWVSYSFDSAVIAIENGGKSHQLAVLEQNGRLSILSMLNIMKSKTLTKNKTIQNGIAPISKQLKMSEINESFLAIANQKGLSFIEINLGYQVGQIEFDEWEKVVDWKNVGSRIYLLAIKGKGLKVAKI